MTCIYYRITYNRTNNCKTIKEDFVTRDAIHYLSSSINNNNYQMYLIYCIFCILFFINKILIIKSVTFLLLFSPNLLETKNFIKLYKTKSAALINSTKNTYNKIIFWELLCCFSLSII